MIPQSTSLEYQPSSELHHDCAQRNRRISDSAFGRHASEDCCISTRPSGEHSRKHTVAAIWGIELLHSNEEILVSPDVPQMGATICCLECSRDEHMPAAAATVQLHICASSRNSNPQPWPATLITEPRALNFNPQNPRPQPQSLNLKPLFLIPHPWTPTPRPYMKSE